MNAAALQDLLSRIYERLRNEPVAVRTAVTMFIVTLHTQTLDLLDALGLDVADGFAGLEPESVEKAVGVVIVLVTWLGTFGARRRVTPVRKIADEGGEVWGEHLGD